MKNATFYTFELGGKHRTTARGYLSPAVFERSTATMRETRDQLCDDNGGHYPGLDWRGGGLTFVVIPDDEVNYGWPLLLAPA